MLKGVAVGMEARVSRRLSSERLSGKWQRSQVERAHSPAWIGNSLPEGQG
jgi:hypothetical protein